MGTEQTTLHTHLFNGHWTLHIHLHSHISYLPDSDTHSPNYLKHTLAEKKGIRTVYTFVCTLYLEEDTERDTIADFGNILLVV